MIADVLRRAGNKPGVRINVGSFTKQGTTGNQDIAIPVDLTSAPAGSWAIMFWTNNASLGTLQVSGTWDIRYAASLGFVANGGGSVSQYVTLAQAFDAQNPSITSRRMAAACISCLDAAEAVYAEATFSSFPSSTTMRINWSSAGAGETKIINYMIISGLTGAKVVNWTKAAGVGSKTVTGAGFKPDLVFHAQAANLVMPSSYANSYLGFGVMNKYGQQWANSIFSSDAANPSNTSRWQQTDACLLCVDNSEGTSQQAHFEEMNSDGFKVYFSTAANFGGDTQHISLCLGGVSSKIGAFTKTAGTSPHSQTVDTRHGFTVKGALSTNFSETPKTAPIAHGEWALGATDTTNQRTVALSDKDAVTPSEAKSLWRNDAFISVPTIGSSEYQRASWTSSTTSTVTLGWTHTSEYATEHLYLLLGDADTDTFPTKVAV